MTDEGGAGAPTGAPAASLVGTAINVVDIERSVAFYTDVLGMVESGRWEHGDGEKVVEVLLRTPDRPDGAILVLAAGVHRAAGPPSVDSFGRLMVSVPDVDAVCDRVRSCGGSIEREPSGIDGGVSIAMVRDPDGVMWELIASTGSSTR
ncbi:MAG: VOC family protein [Acidimicrobiia bacterium]